MQARILQENGNDAQALDIFEKLISQYPENEHFQAAKTFALLRLGKIEDAASSNINRAYTEIGKKLTGANDKPEVWINELNTLIAQTDSKKLGISTEVVW
ncbi:MAG TPA: tetratricopeptide repeat protein [Aquella sp.]|nr:tetratricopeptide repeat protein [Aquella sp.]